MYFNFSHSLSFIFPQQLRKLMWIVVKYLLQTKDCNFIKKETLAQVFSWEFCKISKNTFSYRTPLNDCFCSYNQMTFGYKSLLIFRPKIWNKPPYHIKSRENLKSFKELIKKLGFYTLQLKSLQKEFLIFGICFHNLVHALEKQTQNFYLYI